jgi:hypothetical protein
VRREFLPAIGIDVDGPELPRTLVEPIVKVDGRH